MKVKNSLSAQQVCLTHSSPVVSTARTRASRSQNIENEGFASKEAEKLYDEIFFFTDAGSLELPDDELVEMLKEDNPEWFE